MAVSNVELRVGATQAITALKNVNTQAQKFNQTVNGTNSKLKDANKALPILSKGFFGAGAGAKGASLGFKAAGAALMTALGPLAAGLTAVTLLTKAFHPADFANLQNELPENVLNEIELFLFGVNQNATIDNVKES